ncbi:hypothetical protein ACFYYR_31145 [Streptomyces sp. NPDC001922]|uniref:hypothetical protein n=1 Tax=Streptomyces sp. NPDC001922 TaxID=3364624 RepID=UPI0036782BAE
MQRGKSVVVALGATAALLGPVGIAIADGSTPGSAPSSASSSAPAQDGRGKGAGPETGHRQQGQGKKHRGQQAHGKKRNGARRLCKRAPRIEQRIERVLRRLKGGPEVRGSVARLTARAEKAKKADNTEIATFLNHKLTFRKSLVQTLEKRQKDLAEVEKWCAARSKGSGA